MWVISKEVLTAYNVSHLKVIVWHLFLVKNNDPVEIYKGQVYMYVINVHQSWALIFFN